MEFEDGMQATEKEPEPITLEEFKVKTTALSDAISALWDEDLPSEIRIQREQALITAFLQEQLAEKDRFRHVFRTEKGSTYFVFMGGESVRMKQDRDQVKLQPPCKKIFYVDASQGASLQALERGHFFQEKILNMPIQTVPCQEGAAPIEFGLTHLPPIAFNEHDNEIVLLGDKMGIFASGYHHGHPITEILK